ncbi:AAA family ATPase [Rhodococcus sp. C3V]|uniref:AAA family ATPase n=1 Tax=Rhodococcus sp. C3V TaxID=3034165 RepID=UPI0023E34ADB|nr:AAA family ATPase [Rhodococcus sp. C3V]MDF3317605.1 AAA family ATPase [Rhodococcus sp. C3V]
MEWRVRDFKGISACELDLAPGTTTILTGTNSSGKTSLLQSLLLLRQSGQARDGIVLNGPLVRLGKATDLVRDGADQSTAKFTISEEERQFDFQISSSAPSSHDAAEINDADPLNSEMHLTDLSIQRRNNANPALHFSKDYVTKIDAGIVMDSLDGASNYSILHLKTDGVRLTSGKYARTYVSFRGLRCVQITKFYPQGTLRKQYTKRLRELIKVYLDWAEDGKRVIDTSLEYRHSIQYVVSSLHHDLSHQLSNLAPNRRHKGKRPPKDTHPIHHNSNEEKLVSELIRLNESQIEELIFNAVEERCKVPSVSLKFGPWRFPSRFSSWYYEENIGILEAELFDIYKDVINEIDAFTESWQDLSRRINYLGPLRDEPRVVWSQWNSVTPGLPVGSRGELTANYYAKNRERIVSVKSPPIGHTSQKLQQTLAVAVEQWIEYLGIGSSISATSYGKIGVGLEVTWEGKRRDLTSLGVGVSQTVPIVIAGLAAPPNSIFIVEQPELHLHPDVQAKLADFFIYSRPDVNYVIETHSESLITRVRRRIAEGELTPDKVHLTFVEPDDCGKESNIPAGARSRRIEFTSMGDLSDWPTGFIGSSLEDTQAIMKATIKRLESEH